MFPRLMMFGLLTAALPAAVQAQDKAAQNRDAVRQIFPIVKLFDQKPAVSQTGTVSTAKVAAQDVLPDFPIVATPQEIGVTVAAPALTKGVTATFDIAGFRLGMSEEEVIAHAKAQGMTGSLSMRVINFETRVRRSVNMTAKTHYPDIGRSVPEDGAFEDGKGGRILLKFECWPDGGHLRSITYLAPYGTDPAAWRELLIGKYGPASSMKVEEHLNATWSGAISMGASLSRNGGTLSLGQNDALRAKSWELQHRTAEERSLTFARKPSF